MRRTLPTVLAATLLFAACGDDDDGADDTSAAGTEAESTDSEPAATEPAETEPSDSEPAATEPSDSEPAATEPSDSEPPASDAAAASDYPDKPEVEVPKDLPTELESVTLVEGSGPEAEAGDLVIVDYVGVRTRDGEEFDSSYSRQSPFPVNVGAGEVIPGWDEGLVGVQEGQRLRLDIPSDLAYGEQGSGELIAAGDALTFVVDVRKVISPDPDSAPTEAGVPESVDATETTSVDLIEGEGDELMEGDTAVLHLVLFRGDNLTALDTSWEGPPAIVPIAEPLIPGLIDGMTGMKVGGRRAIVIPPEEGFGAEGNPQSGLPAETDIVFVIDLLGKF